MPRRQRHQTSELAMAVEVGAKAASASLSIARRPACVAAPAGSCPDAGPAGAPGGGTRPRSPRCRPRPAPPSWPEPRSSAGAASSSWRPRPSWCAPRRRAPVPDRPRQVRRRVRPGGPGRDPRRPGPADPRASRAGPLRPRSRPGAGPPRRAAPRSSRWGGRRGRPPADTLADRVAAARAVMEAL